MKVRMMSRKMASRVELRNFQILSAMRHRVY
jgi:hypothetical protein